MYKSPRYFLTSFDSIGLMVKMFRLDFHGSHFGFCIGTIFINYLFYFYLQVALIFSTKFRVNWPLCSGKSSAKYVFKMAEVAAILDF